MRRHAPSVAVIAVAAAIGACTRPAPEPTAQRQEQLVPVGAIVAQTAGIRAVIHVSGLIVPAEGAEFLAVPPEPARIAEVTKVQGDAVTSGEVLVRFELPSATGDVSRVAFELSSAQAQLENARINQSRVRDFVERGLVPRRDLDDAERELADAQTTVNRIRTAHKAAESAAARAVIRAPFGGIVATRRYAPGDIVTTTADAVLRIVDPRRLDVIAQVPEMEIARVVPGATARIAGPLGSEPIRLTVAGRLPPERTAGGTLPVRLLFAQPAELPVDTTVQIDIDAEERADTVLLPAEAIVRDGAESVVFVVAGGRAERRVVTTGITDDAQVEITGGIKAGELVINRGHIGLTDGEAISVDRQAGTLSR